MKTIFFLFISSYIVHQACRIRQAITRAIAQKARTIRLPNHVVENLNKIKKTQRQLSQQLRRTPTTNEIANFLDIDLQKLQQYLSYLNLKVISLDFQNIGDKLAASFSDSYVRIFDLKTRNLVWQVKPGSTPVKVNAV